MASRKENEQFAAPHYSWCLLADFSECGNLKLENYNHPESDLKFLS